MIDGSLLDRACGRQSTAGSGHPTPLLRVDGLRVAFATASGPLEVVRGVSFTIQPGETLALVG
ncbi:MAG: hypothetical protein Q7J57_05095, partial [Gemmobacter sp.]|nr:hypothetical protein [Gemmobacter sp.]